MTCAAARTVLDFDRATVKRCDFPYQRQAQPYAPVFPAARLVNAEKRLEHAVSVLFGDSKTLVFDADENSIAFLVNRYIDRRGGTAVANRVLDKVEHHPIHQWVAAAHQVVPLAGEGDALLVGERGEVC